MARDACRGHWCRAGGSAVAKLLAADLVEPAWRPGGCAQANGKHLWIGSPARGRNVNKLCFASMQTVHENRIADCGARRSSYPLASTANVACGCQDTVE